MKALEIAYRFQSAFTLAPPGAGAAGYLPFVEQSSEEKTLPRVTFEVGTKALHGSSNALIFDLVVMVESAANPTAAQDVSDPPALHAAAVEAVRAWLFTTGKAAVQAAVDGSGFSFRNWGAIDSDLLLQGDHFKTPLVAAGVVLVV